MSDDYNREYLNICPDGVDTLCYGLILKNKHMQIAPQTEFSGISLYSSNLKNMETFKKHIAMIKDMGCSDAMGEDTPVAEVCFRTLKRIIKVLTEDKGTMLEDVFDNLMKAVVAISKRPKGRTYGNRIYRCYNYQLFEVMRDRGKAPSDEVFKSCQHMISEVLSSEEVSSVMEGMLKKAQEGIIKKIEIKQESTSEAGEVNDEEIHLILKTHADEVVGGPSRRVTVSRKQVWQSTVNFITARRRVNSDGLLMVRFVGDDLVEDAVDQGGPRREFFRLLVPDMCQKSGMLQFLKGNDGPLTLRPNVKQLADGFFKILGKVIALILVQEGPPVHIFTPSLVKYIVSGTTSGIKPQPTEACDGHVRVGLAKLQEAETGEEFQTALNEFCDWRLSVDGLGGCLMLKDKQKFIEMVSFHFGLTVIQPMADQLMEGLQTYNVLQLMQSNPALATLLTYKPEKCTAAIVLKHLKPVYSSEGSQRQGLEELVMVQLTQFVSSAEAGDLIDLIPEEDIESEAMEQFVRSISPGHVLEYATGSSQKPAGGFRDQPTIQFVHDPHKYLPAANTCSYELILFANEETCTSRFATFMAKALMNGVVFSAL